MKIKEWFQKNVDISREETETRDNVGYCSTLAVVGLGMGMVTGILAFIIQMIVSGHDSQQTWTDVVAGIIVVAMLAYFVYLLLPLFVDKNVTVGQKVVTGLLGLVCLAVPFILGIYLIVLAVMIVAALAALWLALKVWGTSSSSSSGYTPPAQNQNYGPEKYKLDNGTVVTETGFGDYSGSDYHSYERNIDGTFSRKD